MVNHSLQGNHIKGQSPGCITFMKTDPCGPINGNARVDMKSRNEKEYNRCGIKGRKCFKYDKTQKLVFLNIKGFRLVGDVTRK